MDGEPELMVLDDADAVAARGAEIIDEVVTERLAAVGRADVALSGGRVATLLFDRMTAMGRDWEGVHFWIADERCVPATDEESNVRLVRDHLGAPGSVLHAPPDEGTPEQRAQAYCAQIKDRDLDLVMLSIGEDAHTASLFPNDDTLDDDRAFVPVHGAPKPPPERTSLGLTRINGARQRLVLVTGEAKHGALEAALGTPSRSAPSSLLLGRDTTVVVDRDAAGQAE